MKKKIVDSSEKKKRNAKQMDGQGGEFTYLDLRLLTATQQLTWTQTSELLGTSLLFFNSEDKALI